MEVMLGELIEKPQGYNMALTAKAGEIHIGIQVFEEGNPSPATPGSDYGPS